jgi:hypothetical protein
MNMPNGYMLIGFLRVANSMDALISLLKASSEKQSLRNITQPMCLKDGEQNQEDWGRDRANELKIRTNQA